MTNQQAFDLLESGDYAGALMVASKQLNNDPDDVIALFISAQAYSRGERHGMAANLYRRILQLEPDNANAWNNLGHSYHGLADYPNASKQFIKSLQCEGDSYSAYNNLIIMHLNLGNLDEAKRIYRLARFHASTPEEIDECTGQVALALLATRQWATGWDAYECMLKPDKLRKELFSELPRWDGKPFGPKTGDWPPAGEVVIYGEQGLGDEILFASCIPDARNDVRIILECDARLAKLFGRSFGLPDHKGVIATYGTRFTGQRDWLKNHNPKAKCAIGSLAKFYRRSDAAFPGQPYLKPDPEKRAMARALLNEWPGRKIGIAWTGGQKHTRDKDRSLTIEALEPLLSLPGITWVSLQYKGPYHDSPDPRIKHVPIFTQSQDYDDTAALVAELDSVVSVTTTVAFLAGAVGTECHVAVPDHPTWHWGRDGVLPWFPLKLYRRQDRDWAGVVEQIKEAVSGS